MSMKEAYLEKVQAQLAEWHTLIVQNRRSTYAEGRAQRTQQHLEDGYLAACCQVETLQNATGSAWDCAKEAVERAMVDLKLTLDESGAGRAGHNLPLHTSRAHAFAPFPRKE